MNKTTKTILFIILILIIDQGLKFWVKLNMTYGEEFLLFGQEWARIHFVENEGMAFGMKYGGDWGKIFLTIFRLFAAAFLIYILRILLKKDEKFGVIIGVALIFAGAFGNILDSVFYGKIFSYSEYGGPVATLFPEGGGYAPWLMGRVVDMFYFPLIRSTYPSWIPFVGGDDFLFFRPVFNFADAAITTGVLYLLLFQRKFFQSH